MLVSKGYIDSRYNAMERRVKGADLYDPASEPQRKKILSDMKRARPHHKKAGVQASQSTGAMGAAALSGLAGMAAHTARGRLGPAAALGYAGAAGGAALGVERGVRARQSASRAGAHLGRADTRGDEIERLERRAYVKRTTGASPVMSKSWRDNVSPGAREAHGYLERSARRDRVNTLNAPSQVVAGGASTALGAATLHAAQNGRRIAGLSPRRRLAVAGIGAGLAVAGGATAGTGVRNLRGGRETWKRSKVYRGKAAKIRAAGERRERAAVGKSDIELFSEVSKGLRRKAVQAGVKRARRGAVVSRGTKKHYRRGPS